MTRRTFVAKIGAGGLGLAAANALGSTGVTHAQSDIVLENEFLRLIFDPATGLLSGISNRLTQEGVTVHGDAFAVDAEEFRLTPANASEHSVQKKSDERVEVTFRGDRATVVASYELGTANTFCEKRLTILSPSPYRLKDVVVSTLRLSGPPLQLVKYPYQKNVVYFARSVRGGFFLGMELPFDSSSLAGNGTVSLGYKASLKVRQDDPLKSEPIFVGAYRRHSADIESPGLPLGSESEAMLAMTSSVLGPPRHRLMALACGWWCEMQHQTYETDAQVEADMRSLDFLAECGLDGLTDSHPWSGETAKMNALKQGDRYAPGPLVRKLLGYAREKRLKVIFWPTMNNTHPWWKGMGKPFRSDRPDWIMFPGGETVKAKIPTGREFKEHVEGNCIANEPFWQWLMGIQRDGMQSGYFEDWVMDGDFFGGGGVVVPANCPSGKHDHLPGDSNYACERALNRMLAWVRRNYPKSFIGPMCRPAQDLGVWSNRNADSIFTLDEFAEVEPLPGLRNPPINVMYGDKIRKWSRVRVHHDFTPHYLDHPQVFVAPKSMAIELKMKQYDWPSEKIDYVMLSALSSAPNLLFYLPTKAGIPTKDKAEIRKWLDWGRRNARYLLVRKDLPQWPAAGKVDGSAHIVQDRGLVFLFNPNPKAMEARFHLDAEDIGLLSGSAFEVAQAYPENGKKIRASLGNEIVWNVPSETSLVLKIKPAAS